MRSIWILLSIVSSSCLSVKGKAWATQYLGTHVIEDISNGILLQFRTTSLTPMMSEQPGKMSFPVIKTAKTCQLPPRRPDLVRYTWGNVPQNFVRADPPFPWSRRNEWYWTSDYVYWSHPPGWKTFLSIFHKKSRPDRIWKNVKPSNQMWGLLRYAKMF